MSKEIIWNKYFDSFNFYFAKPVNEILAEVSTPQTILYKDLLYYDDDREFLRRFYTREEYPGKYSVLNEYYTSENIVPKPNLSIHDQNKIILKRNLRLHRLYLHKLSAYKEIPETARAYAPVAKRLEKELLSSDEQSNEPENNGEQLPPANAQNIIGLLDKPDVGGRQSFETRLHDIYNPRDSSLYSPEKEPDEKERRGNEVEAKKAIFSEIGLIEDEAQRPEESINLNASLGEVEEFNFTKQDADESDLLMVQQLTTEDQSQTSQRDWNRNQSAKNVKKPDSKLATPKHNANIDSEFPGSPLKTQKGKPTSLSNQQPAEDSEAKEEERILAEMPASVRNKDRIFLPPRGNFFTKSETEKTNAVAGLAQGTVAGVTVQQKKGVDNESENYEKLFNKFSSGQSRKIDSDYMHESLESPQKTESNKQSKADQKLHNNFTDASGQKALHQGGSKGSISSQTNQNSPSVGTRITHHSAISSDEGNEGLFLGKGANLDDFMKQLAPQYSRTSDYRLNRKGSSKMTSIHTNTSYNQSQTAGRTSQVDKSKLTSRQQSLQKIYAEQTVSKPQKIITAGTLRQMKPKTLIQEITPVARQLSLKVLSGTTTMPNSDSKAPKGSTTRFSQGTHPKLTKEDEKRSNGGVLHENKLTSPAYRYTNAVLLAHSNSAGSLHGMKDGVTSPIVTQFNPESYKVKQFVFPERGAAPSERVQTLPRAQYNKSSMEQPQSHQKKNGRLVKGPNDYHGVSHFHTESSTLVPLAKGSDFDKKFSGHKKTDFQLNLNKVNTVKGAGLPSSQHGFYTERGSKGSLDFQYPVFTEGQSDDQNYLEIRSARKPQVHRKTDIYPARSDRLMKSPSPYYGQSPTYDFDLRTADYSSTSSRGIGSLTTPRLGSDEKKIKTTHFPSDSDQKVKIPRRVSETKQRNNLL